MPVALDDRVLKGRLFRGFAEPSRLAILETLRAGPACVSEIAARTGLSQPNASMHLACLEGCGLVRRRRRGQFVEYAIADRLVLEVLRGAERLLERVGDQMFQCTRMDRRET